MLRDVRLCYVTLRYLAFPTINVVNMLFRQFYRNRDEFKTNCNLSVTRFSFKF